jgi:hypothetical protein
MRRSPSGVRAGLLLATPGLPLPAMFAVIFVQGVVTSIGAAVLYGLLGEILPPDGYVLGRSVLNMSVGAMQVTGFALGGILLAVVSPRTTMVIGATLAACSAMVLRLAVYLSMWVPNGLVVGCEALFVPYAPHAAAALFVAAALGMLIGDMAAGRFLPSRLRRRSVTPLRFLLAAPYLLFAFAEPAGRGRRGRHRIDGLCVDTAATGAADRADRRGRPRSGSGAARDGYEGDAGDRGDPGRPDGAVSSHRYGDDHAGGGLHRRHRGAQPRPAAVQRPDRDARLRTTHCHGGSSP